MSHVALNYAGAANALPPVQIRLQPDFALFVKHEPVVILPGGFGSELEARGYKAELPLWSASANLDAFALVRRIHIEYLAAGADIISTNTFRTTRRAFKAAGRENDARFALDEAYRAAHEARETVTNRPVYIGGSVAPLEDCYRPDLVPDDATLDREHLELARWHKAAGADFLMFETVNSVREAAAMARAAVSVGLPFTFAFTVDDAGKLLDGSTVEQALAATNHKNRVAIAFNCCQLDAIAPALAALPQNPGCAIGAYANGFFHARSAWQQQVEEGPRHPEKHYFTLAQFTRAARGWQQKGARLIGGCCGTTPAHIRALNHALKCE